MIRTTTLAIALLSFTACTRPSEPPRSEATPAPDATGGAAETPAPPSDGGAPGATGTGRPNDVSTATQPATPEPQSAAAAPQPQSEPSGPIPMPVTSAVAITLDAQSPLPFDQPSVVEPTARFAVDVAVPLVDARIALLDSGYAMVAAAESHEIGSSWSRFTLEPDAPLRPGSTYTLRLDGAADRDAHDADGRAYQVTTWEIRVAGEPPPPEKPAPKGKRRR